jgi:hypothetical protein
LIDHEDEGAPAHAIEISTTSKSASHSSLDISHRGDKHHVIDSGSYTDYFQGIFWCCDLKPLWELHLL